MLSHSVVSNSSRSHGLYPTRLLCPWGFSRQEYWSGLPCPSPGDLPNPGNEPRSLTLQVNSLPSESPGKPKNTGVGEWVGEVTQLCLTLCDPMDCSPLGSSVHGDSPGKNTGAGCHALLQGESDYLGSNPTCITYSLSNPEKLLTQILFAVK